MATAFVLQNQAEVFAANRATGRIELSVQAAQGRTRRRRLHEDGSLRVRFPNAAAGPLEAVIINTAGGMTGGDRFAIDIAVGANAALVAGTAAADGGFSVTLDGKPIRTPSGRQVVAPSSAIAESNRLLCLSRENRA